MLANLGKDLITTMLLGIAHSQAAAWKNIAFVNSVHSETLFH